MTGTTAPATQDPPAPITAPVDPAATAPPVAAPPTAAPPAVPTAPAPLTYGFKAGSIVKVKDGRYAVVVATGAAPREKMVENATTGESRVELVDAPGYVLAYFAAAIDSPHTAQELGLEAT